MNIRYIGSFPPPYGGVTIKNKLLFECLSENHQIRKLNKPACLPNTLFQAINMLTALLPNQKLIIGVSAVGGKSRLISKLLFLFGKKNMKRSLYFMMGGQECYRISASREEIKWYANYRRIYVETETMKSCMVKAGLENVEVFPNCRRKPTEEYQPLQSRGRVRCVFFSNIQREKGVDIILEAANQLPNAEFIFYGNIAPGYIEDFRKRVESLDNCKYMGVFKGTSESVYRELAQYDVLLFPTKWDTEGVPGILVEAKMAGLPCIASNKSYNAELVRHGEEGIILEENNVESLVHAIELIDRDRELLNKLSKGSFRSAEKFYVENYVDRIILTLQHESCEE